MLVRFNSSLARRQKRKKAGNLSVPGLSKVPLRVFF
jgi:hypothetical protein